MSLAVPVVGDHRVQLIVEDDGRRTEFELRPEVVPAAELVDGRRIPLTIVGSR